MSYGVIDTDKNDSVTTWREKSEITSNINTDCYVMESVFSLILDNTPYGIDSVVEKTMSQKKNLSSFSIKKEFTDVGDMTSSEKAYEEFKKKLGKL